jgi:hypothetical protein
VYCGVCTRAGVDHGISKMWKRQLNLSLMLKNQAHFTVVCLPQIIKYSLGWSRPAEQPPLLPLLLLLRRLCPRMARLKEPPGSAKH